MEERESTERKSLLIRTILIIILLLLSLLSTILYVYLYPKTTVNLYIDSGADWSEGAPKPYSSFSVKRYSKLSSLPGVEKTGYTFDYWSQDGFEGEEFDLNTELNKEVINLYANYHPNQYVITYWVRDFTAGSNAPWKIYQQQTKEYYTQIDLVTGRDSQNKLLPEFVGRSGFTFYGWTLENRNEDDPELEKYLYIPNSGIEYIYKTPGDMNLYAYFKKNTYSVNLHTGIKYELDETGKPRKDENNNYIIKNASSDGTENTIITDNVRYMDSLGLIAERHKNMQLSDVLYGAEEAQEYAFKGWYLDQDYTIAIDDHELILYVDAVTGVPFYECYIDGVRKVVSAVQKTGADGNPEYDNDGNPKYIFDIYSKWERKCYEVNFNKNTIKANAYQVESIHLYKVNFDEDGNAVGFGKYYNDGLFTYQGYADGGHYCKVNLANLDVVSDDFRNGITDSGGKPTYRLIGWTDSANLRNNENVAWYAKWTQVAWNRDTVAGSEINGKLATGEISYDNQVYTQTSSDDVTLYAQWSQIYNIKFAYDRGSNQKNFVWQGIAGEWFILPNMNDIKANNNGKEWEKTYCFFAGWTTGTSTLSPKYYERIGGKQDAALDPEYYYKISGSQTLLAIWLSEPYTIEFDANGGTLASPSDAIKSPVYGNSLLTFPKNKPTREGYIFNGWSKTPYSDGEYNRLLREATDAGTKLESDKTVYSAGGQYRVTGNCKYYASWMKDYIIEYDANGGEITSGDKVNKYSTLLSADNRSVSGQSNKALLKVRMQIGDKIGIEREGHEFVCWNLRKADGSIDTTVTIKSTKINTPYTTFDFYEYKLYAYKSQGGNVDEKSKIAFDLVGGNKVVLVASWKPIEYRLKIEDTRASDPTKKTYTYTVEYGQEFTFPELPELIHKVGFQLYGFSTSLEEGKGVTYVISYNDDGTIKSMPTIGGEDSRITQNLTFYTVYVEKKFEIKYYIGETTDKEYTPKTTDISQGISHGLISYGQTLVLPKLLESNITEAGFDSKYKFKYWYYTMTDAEGNTVEKIVETGDLATYHNSDNVLELHAKLQVDSYNLILRITNPFEGGDSVIVTDLAIGSFEKGVAVGTDAYNQIMYKLNAKLSQILGDYVLRKVMAKDGEGNDTEDIAQLILKGYTFEKLSATETFNQFDFNASTVVQISDSTLYVKTKWVANSINIIYNSDEESTNTNKSSIKYNESLNFLPGTIFTYDGGRVVNSWYIKSTKDGFDPTFFDCSSALKDSKTKYKTLNALSQDGYITWADDGTGTIELFANTQQICTVTYHYFNGTTEQTIQKQFVFGDSAELLTNDQVPCGEYTFEGWYYNGQKVDYVPVSEGNYNIDLYANYVATITYYNIIKDEIYTKIDKVKQLTIDLLDYDEETATYSYTKIYQIENLDLTLTNYDLYGFVDTNTNQLYLIENIKNGNAYVALEGNNINLEAYYTEDYKLVYLLNDATLETFEDGTTEDKTDVFKFDHNNKPVTAVTIAYKAVKAGYNFLGWKISGQDTVYGYGATIDLASRQTTVNPVFGEPTDGTIDVTITLVKNEQEDDTRSLTGLAADGSFDVRNGKTFTFTESLIKDKFNWQSDTDDLYRFKVDENTKKYVGGRDYFEIGESFTIPLAIEADTELKFVGEWIKKYVIEFNQDENHQNAKYDTKKVILRQGQEYTLQETPTVSTEGIEFQYWQVIVKNGAVAQTVNVYVGEIIVVTDQEKYSSNPVIKGNETTTKHNLPKIDGLNNTYEFIGVWSKKEYTIKLNVIDGSNTYTLTLNNVPYGTKISNRQMLNLDYEYLKLDGTLTTENETALNKILALENNARGIYAWATDAEGTNIADLSSITSDMTLYAVWQTKLTLDFADENDEFEYKDNVKPDTKYLLPNTQIDLNYIVESIYRKGNFTVIYKDGKYQVVGSANDYYQLVAFNLDFADGTSLNLQIDANNTFGTFEITQNTVVTPQFEKVGKVYFFDNTTSTGGSECKKGDTEKFLQFVRNGQTLSLDTFVISREGFTFVGWNTNKDAETKLDSVAGNGSDINIYAVWASDRKAKFVLRLGNQNYDLFEFALTRLNKINSDNLSHYLTTPADNHQFKQISALSKFPAYSFNNYNLYLINFYVTDSAGNVNYYDNDSLCEQDFGSGSYNSIGDITVYLNTTDIFTIKYSLGGIEGIVGNINSDEYFVAADKLDGVDTPFGKLDEATGTIVSLILPDQLNNNTVQRNNYQPYGWSESANIADKINTNYFFSNQESLVLYDTTSASADKEQKLRDIATNLRKGDSQTYTLYLVWEYKYIDTYIYAIADVGTDETSETVLTAPYEKYSLSTDGTGIAFANVANFLYTYNQSGQRTRIYPLDNNWQFTSNGKIAQVQYNSTIYLNDTTGNVQAGGYQLLGFSQTLYKLGVEVSDNYFKLGDPILVTENILTDGKLILYPVYGMLADAVAVSTTYGSVNVKIESVTPQGFVGKSPTEAVDEKIEAYRSKTYTVTLFDKITVIASEPMLGYVFKEFHTDDVTQGDITTNVIVVDASCYFVSVHAHNHEIEAHYDTVEVTLNIHLDYKVALKDEYKGNETGVITFKTTLNNADFELTVDKDNLVSSGTVKSTNTFAYTITQSPYYTFALYSDANHTNLIRLNGGEIVVADLIDGGVANIYVLATPKTYKVIFSLSSNSRFETSSKVTAVSSTYFDFGGENIEFDIAGGAAYVYMGSSLLLPTSATLSSSSMKITSVNSSFVGFYLSGDTDKNIIVNTDPIEKDTTFVELYNSDSITITYILAGSIIRTFTYTANTVISVGSGVDWDALLAQEYSGAYTLLHWTDGTKIYATNEQLTIDKAYTFFGVVQGSTIKLVYKYELNGADTTKVVDVEYGKDIEPLTESQLGVSYSTKYIAMWSYNGNQFDASRTIAFNRLGFVYDSNIGQNTIEFDAVYYHKFTYEISYDTTYVKNSSDFASTTTVAKAYNNEDTSFVENELKFRLSAVEPISVSDENVFSYYQVEFSVDGGTTYLTTQDQLQLGVALNLISPNNGEYPIDVNTPVKYRITPIFKAKSGTITAKFVITNPENNSVIGDDTVVTQDNQTLGDISTFVFFEGNILTDSYLPQITNISDDKSYATWAMQAKSLEFALTLSGFDWNTYKLVGYKADLYDANGNLSETRTFTLGSEADRNLSGANTVTLTTIWEKRIVVKYYTQESVEDIKLREYFDYSNELITFAVRGKITDQDLLSNTTLADFELNGHEWIGWTSRNDNNHVVRILSSGSYAMYNFGTEPQVLEVKYLDENHEINLYPAQAKIYQIKFETNLLDGTDAELNGFEIKADYINNSEYTVYLGKGISMPAYSAIYSKLSSIFDFKGYTDTTAEFNYFDKDYYTFGVENIDNADDENGTITIFANFARKTYTIAFDFVGKNASGEELLQDRYSLTVNKKHGDSVSLSYTYDPEDTTTPYIFADNENLTNGGNSLQSVVNGMIVGDKCDFLKIKNFTLNGVEIVSLSSITDSVTVVVNFEPIYRLQYNLNVGYEDSYYYKNGPKEDDKILPDSSKTNLPGYGVIGETVVEIGKDSYIAFDVNKQDENDNTYIVMPGFTLKFWKEYNNTKDEDFFNRQNKITITQDLINSLKITNDYRIQLTVAYATAYTINLHYFESIDDMQNGNYSNNTISISSETDNRVAIGASFDAKLTGTLTDAFNSLLAKSSIMVNGKNITALFDIKNESGVVTNYGLFNAFDSNDYTSQGLARLGSKEGGLYALMLDAYDLSSDIKDFYIVQSYDELNNPLEHDLYIVYVPAKHTVNFNALVGKEESSDGTTKFVYDSELATKYVLAEYAMTLDQVNKDDGSEDVDSDNRRQIAYAPNWASSSQVVDFQNYIYLIKPECFTSRISSNSNYDFVGWKVLIASDSGENITYSFVDLSEVEGLTITNEDQRYIKISGIHSNLNIVACFVQKQITTEVTLRSTDNLGHKLGIDILDNNGTALKTDSVVENAENCEKIYTFKAVLNSTIQFKSTFDQYKVKSFDFGYTYEGDTITITDAYVVDGKFKIVVTLDYASTKTVYLDVSNGRIETVNYTYTVGGVDYERSAEASAIQGISFNGGQNYATYQVVLPLGAKINSQSFGTPTLSNYTFTRWQYFSGKLNDFETLLVSDTTYLCAKYDAKQITVKFAVKNLENAITEITGIGASVRYGQDFTLPTIIVELNGEVTIGYIIDSQLYSFGDTFNFDRLTGEIADEYQIYLTTQRIYNIAFTVDKTTFEWPNNSPYPTVDSEVKVKVVSSPISIESGVEYYFANSIENGKINVTTKTNGYSLTNTYDIPVDNITSTNGVQFEEWATRTSKTYINGQTYTVSYADADDNGIILFTAVAGNKIKVEFVVIDPQNGQTLKLTTNKNVKPTLESITMLIPADNASSANIIDFGTYNDNYISFNEKSVNGTTINSYLAEFGLGARYKLYGFSSDPAYYTYTNISDFVGKSYAISYYKVGEGGLLVELTEYEKAEALVNAINAGVRTFYTVWEQKFEVKFVNDTNNQVVSSTYYGKDETIAIPARETVLNANDSNLKIQGWKDTTNKYQYTYQTIAQSLIFEGSQTLEFRPVWAQGHSLTLNMGFDNNRYGKTGNDIRNTVADIFKTYSALDRNEIYAGIGYPYIDSATNVKGVSLIGEGNIVTIGGKNLHSAYRFGELWTENDIIDLSSLKATDSGIYDTLKISFDYGANISNSYYKFVGWSTVPDGDAKNKLTDEQLSSLSLGENTTLYAVWEPVTYTVTLYATAENAGNEVDAKQTLYYSFEDSIYTQGKYIYKNGKESGFEENVNEDNFAKIGYRLSGWKNYNEKLVLTNDPVPVVGNIKLVSEYAIEYIVRFKNIKEIEFSSVERQYVVNGEEIKFDKSLLINKLQVTNAYYLDKTKTPQYIFDKDGTLTNVQELPSKITFSKNAFDIIEVGGLSYVDIYLDVDVSIAINIPNKDFGISGQSEWLELDPIKAVPEATYELTSTSIRLLGSSDEDLYSFNISDYDNGPTMLGWFYYISGQADWYKYEENPIVPNYYLLSDLDYAVRTLKVIYGEDGVNVIVTTQNGNTYTLSNISEFQIRLYPKLVTTNTISLANIDAASFAKLTYTDSKTLALVENPITDNAGNIQSVKFMRVFNSTYDNVFSIETEGYLIDSIANISGASNLADNSVSFGKSFENKTSDSDKTLLKATLSKSTDTGLGTLKFTYQLNFANYSENNTNYVVSIVPYTFNVSYQVSDSEGILQYRTNPLHAAEDYSKTASASSPITISMPAGQVIYQYDKSTGSVLVSDIVQLKYYYSNNDGITTITFVGVPYGADLYTPAIPQNYMISHFVGFEHEINGAMVDGEKITYKPYGQNNDLTQILDDFVVKAQFEVNSISAVKLILDFDTASLGGNNSPWANAISSYIGQNSGEGYKSIIPYSKNGNEYYRYTVIWKNNGLTLSADNNQITAREITAGTDITNLLKEWKQAYHIAFDQEHPTSMDTVTNINNLNVLLQYFWLSDKLNWTTDQTTLEKGTKFDNGVLLYSSAVNPIDNSTTTSAKIYALHDSTVELHFNMAEAITMIVDTATIDYTDNNIISDITRAQVSLQETVDRNLDDVNEYIFQKSGASYVYKPNYSGERYDSMVIKFQKGSQYTINVHPVGADEKHVAYSFNASVDWSLGAGASNTNNSGVFNGSKLQTNNDGVNELFNEYTLKGAVRKIPYITLTAKIRPVTYQVKFDGFSYIDSDNNYADSYILNLAYDKEIFDKGNYDHYGYTLTTLYNSSRHNIPRFVLTQKVDGSTPVCFVATVDKCTELHEHSRTCKSQYGDLTKIFEYWVKDSGTGNLSASSINMYTYNNGYQNIQMRANFIDAVKITFVRFEYDEKQSIDRLTYNLYLAPNGFKDQLGEGYVNARYNDNLYQEGLTTQVSWFNEARDKYKVENISGDVDNAFIPDLRVMNETNATHAQVATLRDLIGNATIDNENQYNATEGYIIYPVILKTIKLGAHFTEPSRDSNRNGYLSENNLVIYTLGGKYDIKMQQVDDRGELSITNITSKIMYRDSYIQNATGRYLLATDSANDYNITLKKQDVSQNLDIIPMDYSDYTFAMWEVGSSNIHYSGYDQTNTVLMSLDSAIQRCDDEIYIYPHYNARLFISEDEGLTYDANNLDKKYSGNYLALTDYLSQEFISRDSATKYTLKYEETGRDATGLQSQYALLNVYKGTEVLYAFKFVARDAYKDNIVWKINTAANSEEVILTPKANTYTIDDGNGTITLSPIAYINVNMKIDDFVIINRTGYSASNAFTYTIKNSKGEEGNPALSGIEVSGGNTFQNYSYSDTNGNWQMGLVNFVDEVTHTVIVKNTSAFASIQDYLTNYRWQYLDDGVWKNITDTTIVNKSSNTKVNGNYEMHIRLVADWQTREVIFRRLTGDKTISSDWELKYATEFANYTINGSKTDVAVTLYKGQTIKFSDTSYGKFDIYENGSTVSTIEAKDVIGGYYQGWWKTDADVTRLTSLVADETVFDYNSGNMTFYLWIEKQITVTLSASQESGHEQVAGYGIVYYSHTNPRPENDVEETEFKINKTNKTYGTITLGISSKLKVSAIKDPDANHEFVSFVYPANTNGDLGGGNATTTNYVGGFEGAVGSIQPQTCTISVFFDAYGTKSTLTIVNENQEIVSMGANRDGISAVYDLYGGYDITKEVGSDKYTYTITDFWNKVEHKFYVSKNEPKSSVADTYYPREFYRISKVTSHEEFDLTYDWTAGRFTTELSNGTDVATGTTHYNGINTRNAGHNVYYKSFVDKYDEYPYITNVSFDVWVTDANGAHKLESLSLYNPNDATSGSAGVKVDKTYISGNHETLTKDTVFVGTKEKPTLQIVDINKNNKANIQVNEDRQGVLFNISEFESIIKCTKPGYKLTRVAVCPGTDYVDSSVKASASYPADKESQDFTVEETYYHIRIFIEQKAGIDVAFKLNLPNGADLRNINLKDEKSGSYIEPRINAGMKVESGVLSFNAEAGKYNTESFVSALPVGTTVTAGYANSRYYVEFRDKNGVQLYRYSFELPAIYSLDGGKGWFIDSSDTHLLFTNEEQTIGNYKFNVWKYEKSQVLNEDPYTLRGDCTLVLGLKRNPVTIYSNANYWSGLGKTTLTDDVKEWDAILNAKGTGSSFVAPGGLIELEVPEDSRCGETLYQAGSSPYIGQSNVNIPQDIKNIRLAKISSVTYGAKLTISGETWTMSNTSPNNAVVFIANNRNSKLEDDKIKSYLNVEFTKDTAWTLVAVPYGDADSNNTNGNNYTKVTFYKYIQEMKDNASLGTYSINNDDLILKLPNVSLTQSNKNNPVVSMNIAKGNTTRLYGGLFRESEKASLNSSRYNFKTLTFDAKLAILKDTTEAKSFEDLMNSDKRRCKLIGYKFVLNGSSLEAKVITGGDDVKVNLQKLFNSNNKSVQDVSVYPIFQVSDGHDITIRKINDLSTNLVSDTSLNQLKQSNINADLLSGNDVTYNIEEGKSFNWQTALQTLSLLSSSSANASQSNYYSFRYNLKDGTTKVFVGFKVYDINGNLLSSIGKNGLIPLLEYSSSLLKNFNYEGFADSNDKVADVEGGLSGGQYQLKFTPKDNLVLEPCFSTLGVTVTYTCTQILSEKTIDNASYIIENMTETQKSAYKITQVIKYNQLDIIPVNVGKDLLIPFGSNSLYFGWRSPYFSIVNSYKYTNHSGQTQFCTGANMISIFDIQGSMITFTAKHSSCDMDQTDEDNYTSGCYWSTTKYFNCTICSNESSDFNDGYDHVSDEGNYSYVDEDGHKLVKKCIKCNTELSSVKSAHDYGSWADNGELIHFRVCSCCTARQEDGHKWGNAWENPDDKSQHVYTCSLCSYNIYQNHNYDTSNYQDLGDTHALECEDCEHQEISAHLYGTPTVTKSPTCTKEGESISVCTYCSHPQTNSIRKLGHNYEVSAKDSEPALCFEDGLEVKICTRCGDTVKTTLKARGRHGKTLHYSAIEKVATGNDGTDKDGNEIHAHFENYLHYYDYCQDCGEKSNEKWEWQGTSTA